jgi:hypothetical protein
MAEPAPGAPDEEPVPLAEGPPPFGLVEDVLQAGEIAQNLVVDDLVLEVDGVDEAAAPPADGEGPWNAQ